VKPYDLIRRFFDTPAGRTLDIELGKANRILIVGAGKAGAAMSQGIDSCLSHYRRQMTGLVNVPDGIVRALETIRLHAARPAASNQPTHEGLKGAERILDLVQSATQDDIVICLLSGGASALLPLPVASVSLEDKQRVTLLLHECGASIQEMNALRKHLSRIKGGQLVRNFKGRSLHSLTISDVIDDPLDVIASGPTAPDPTTFADALSILGKYELLPRKGLSTERKVSESVKAYLEQGSQGLQPETPKNLPLNINNHVIGNNELALAAAESQARSLGYLVVNLGSSLDGESRRLGEQLAAMAESVQRNHRPVPPPACILCGGETIVTLTHDHGLGGRNQEFVLSALEHLSRNGTNGVVILSGGTDGEDGPTDAAGACADSSTLARAESRQLQAGAFLARHDAYHFFEATGDLMKTGLTETNVNDVRIILIGQGR
jgi:hydroxypyruvate reductase/glycerate 2-kinase